ncbi:MULTISPECIES: beta-ketoacyl-ACP synthase II [unclassified Pseudodesulfovibrio]|uniref:beta-ketoacyl-ACP synthase II n=1 Tax=unclassified Pseudodesulfovibrio TaxID=2661612 RepID=UPI000FEC1C49|nr:MULTISPECIES: beta-ketoacyl-ACP synthase II [unclassified Pseudodesulfovibrio]MCJ2164911.1 beta-ketoacyl-ACP synthase II [Pseudodesulfovibrio sp. S3-i]RWU03726.1 beta-ketoacyl-[acyl-carrier-protein] synthase II [Pseudodesulfovibrio sp. S3]
MNRVVVTSVAAVTPLGNDAESSWQNLLAGKSGIGKITKFDTTDFATKIAGEVKGFDPDVYIGKKEARRMEMFTQYAVVASKMLFETAGWTIPESERDRVGTIIGVGLGGLETIEDCHEKLLKRGPSKISPFFIPVLIANMAAGQVSIATGAMGPNICTTTACASGTHGVGTAYTDIAMGRVNAMICGGAESTITPLAVAGFNAMKALSVRNDEPELASRPFDKDRTGFIMGEGCGLLLLESLEHAKARGANILAEVVGYGASGDAYHMTAPPEDGSGMAYAMAAAIREAKIDPTVIDHINAHGTSTYLNDLCETRAIKKVFGDHAYNINICANKSQIGHLLGAAGGVEAVFAVKTLAEGVIPGTINRDTPDPECDLDVCADGPREKQVEYALSNSFGFGGTNACVLFKRFTG